MDLIAGGVAARSLDSGPTPGDAEPWRRHDVLALDANATHARRRVFFARARARDSTQVLGGLVDGSLRLWRRGDGAVAAAPGRGRGRVFAVALLAGGAVAAADGAGVAVRGTLAGPAIREWGRDAKATAMAADGATLAVGFDDGRVAVLDAAALRPAGAPLRASTAAVASLDLAGGVLLAGDAEGTVVALAAPSLSADS